MYANFCWKDLIQNAAARSEFAASCGFYSHVLEDGLVAVLLNTNLYYNTNNTGSDPCGQITWLEETLKGMIEVYTKIDSLSCFEDVSNVQPRPAVPKL